MSAVDPIRRISVFSTGTVQISPDHEASTWRPLFWWLRATPRQWAEQRPINVYVIEHRDGLVLFDTGQDRASVTDPDYFPGGVTGFLYGRLGRFEVGPDPDTQRWPRPPRLGDERCFDCSRFSPASGPHRRLG